MLIVVSYDIRDDRRRTRLADALKDYGTRVQLSVFECLLEPADVERLRNRMAKLIDAEKDSVRIYPLCESCRAKAEVQGQGDATVDPEIYVL
jgi:CRISPR-associated protein Cas2